MNEKLTRFRTGGRQFAGFKRLDFEGLKPAGIRSYSTAVFYRPGNALGL
jgi:hypothetical protein